MKTFALVVAFLIVVIGFAGFQQYQSWSLNKPQSSAQTRSEQSGTGDSGQAPSTGGLAQGRAEAGLGVKPFPVVVATAVQKSVPTQIRAVGNVEAYSTVAIKSQVTGLSIKYILKKGTT